MFTESSPVIETAENPEQKAEHEAELAPVQKDVHEEHDETQDKHHDETHGKKDEIASVPEPGNFLYLLEAIIITCRTRPQT